MSIKDQLQSSLAGIAPFSQGMQTVEAKEGGQELAVELVALDRLACAFECLTVTADTLRGATPERLKQVAERLSSSLTYLLEPISPIEIDAQGCTVQMRSMPPHKDADGTTYYELLVQHSGELSLCRYRRPAGQSRTRIPAEVTREVLLRLAGDFEAAIN